MDTEAFPQGGKSEGQKDLLNTALFLPRETCLPSGYCAGREALGQGAVWTTEFPPVGELFLDVLWFCHAAKLRCTEDRIGLDKEGWP